MTTVLYRGKRSPDHALEVWRQGTDGRWTKLPLRLDIWNHSPTGFECGYGGSGPAQLALAILFDATHERETAARLHQKYKWDVIAKLPRDVMWEIRRADVIKFVLSSSDDPELASRIRALT